MTEAVHVVAAIGNSTCRLARIRGREIACVEAFTHEEWREGSRVRTWIAESDVAARIGICSVVPALTERLRAHLGVGRVVELITAADACAMRVEYEHPEMLGADRYCAALGAREWYGSPVIAVDFGTAITVNVVDARGVFVGGAIVPGYASALQAMHATTAQLPLLEQLEGDAPGDRGAMDSGGAMGEAHPNAHASVRIGQSTRASMLTGVVEVLSRGVDAYVRAVAAQVGSRMADDNRISGSDYPVHADPVRICCTGGGAMRFLRAAGAGWRHDPWLVLRGAAAELRCREALEGL